MVWWILMIGLPIIWLKWEAKLARESKVDDDTRRARAVLGIESRHMESKRNGLDL